MAEENLICPSCQAVMRQRALFCYKCGASIVSNSSAKVKKSGRKKTSELIAQALKKEEISNVWFQDKIVEEKTVEEKAVEAKIEDQTEEQESQEIAEGEISVGCINAAKGENDSKETD
jgi:predicted amidophosphoribosyltransferase